MISPMKIKFLLLGLTLVAARLSAQTLATNTYTLTPGTIIPAGNPNGALEQFDVSGISGSIASIQISLNIIGGYNGDLYAWLVDPQGQTAILLNRPGLTSSDAFGYADAGINITLDDSGSFANVHGYGAGSYNLNGNGQVTGTWASDGRNIDPQSAPGAFDPASVGANLSQFQGGTANGAWSLYLADVVAGGASPTLTDTTLTIASSSISSVPEPSTMALAGLGLAAWLRGHWRRR